MPFPIRDLADLKRAIRFAMKDEHIEARSFVAARAKILGRNDLIPSNWTNRHTMKTMSIDEDFERISRESGITSAKLKTVYLRGIDEFTEGGFDIGTPSLYAIVRVQKFVNALKAGKLPEQDDDLVYSSEPALEAASHGVEFSIDNAYFMNAVLSGDLDAIRDLFLPAQVTSVGVFDNIVEVSGVLDEFEWECKFDMVEQNVHDVSLSVQ